ncbi:hypothetical protein HNQ56_001303 [Anaerotaenia torta]
MRREIGDNGKAENADRRMEPEEDRVIADMNIEGMPWHMQGKSLYPQSQEPQPPLTKKELWRLTFNATAAALLIAIIFLGAFFLFILFCIHVWF